MVAYQHFLELAQSADSDARSQAAHLVATAFAEHHGPMDEQAALYAALFGFLDDPSVKVRAALAHGLLHCTSAPRPVVVALLQDAPVIARAVAQYSPVLLDADLMAAARQGDEAMMLAIASRRVLSPRLVYAILERRLTPVTLAILERKDLTPGAEVLEQVAAEDGSDADIRGALLARRDLPAAVRFRLVEEAGRALRSARIVKGAIAPKRLDRLMRHAVDSVMTHLGELEAQRHEEGFAAGMVESGRVTPRTMIHALVNGHVFFFADCLAVLAETPKEKVFTLLDRGSRAALHALLSRCGLGMAMRNLLARLIVYARSADLADDLAARHFIVTALVQELIVEHDGKIPPALEESFAYLNEQNVMLAKYASRGVMSSFAEEAGALRALPGYEPTRLALPAA